MDLSTVAKLLDSGKPDKALSIMLAVWKKHPLPRLGDAIDALDKLVETPWGPLFADGAQLAERSKRVQTLGKQPRDPRFARALLDYLRAMPFTSNGSRGMWSTVFSALREIDDPRVIAALPEIARGWTIRPLQREWLESYVEPLLEHYGKKYPNGEPAPTTADAKQLAAIEAALASTVPTGGAAQRDALLAEIYANPDDDGPRTVLADHLTDAGDPRGEFITLQLLPSNTSAQAKRIAALLGKHERAWIGPLEPVIAKADVEFTRGFLSGCRVKLKNMMEAERYGRDPSWATVERLRFTGTRFSYMAFSSQESGVFFVDPVMKSLRDVNLHDGDDLAKLLAHRWPNLEHLATSTEQSLGKRGLAALKSTTKLPALSAIEMFAPPKNWLASTKFGKRLREVVLGLSSSNDERGVITWLPELERLPALETATIHASRSIGKGTYYPRWTFSRDDRNKLSIAGVVVSPSSYDRVVATLAGLPATQLTRLTIKCINQRGEKVTPAQRAAMTAAAGRQTKLSDFRA